MVQKCCYNCSNFNYGNCLIKLEVVDAGDICNRWCHKNKFVSSWNLYNLEITSLPNVLY